jgi:hypothetical protein
MKRFLPLLIIFLVIAAVPSALAAEEIKVGTYLLNIGKYDISTGSYTADFYLWFRWNGTYSPENFEFMNGRANKITKLIDEPGYKFYRVEAQLYTDSQLQNYPVDKHDLMISIEDQVLTTNDIVYVVDREESGVSPKLRVLGWNILGSDISVSRTNYENWDESYSTYTHRLTIARPESTLFKTIIPIIFIALTAWICFFIPSRKLGEKLALGGTALLSAVAFHIYITSSLPAVGYLTLADKFIMALYSMLVTVLAGIIIVEKNLNSKKTGLAEKQNRSFKIISLIVPVFVFLMLLLLLY